MRAAVLASLLGSLLGSIGCAGGAPVPAEVAPSTDRDPIAWTPPAQSEGTTGPPVALATAGGEDQARAVVPALLEAIRAGDEAQLARLFADEVASFATEPRRPARSRDSVVGRILVYARRDPVTQSLAAPELVDLGALEVSRAAVYWQGRAMPALVRGTDVVVEVPILEPGRGPLRILLGWHLRGTLVVRPGAPPRIIAI